MSAEVPLFETLATVELANLEAALRRGGFLYGLAREAFGDVPLDTPDDVVTAFEAALKPQAQDGSARPRPRHEIMADAPPALTALCQAPGTRTEIRWFAGTVGIRQDETLPDEQLGNVVRDPALIVPYVRGDGGVTGVVRPGVLEQALPLLAEAGVAVDESALWHFGSRRLVRPLRRNSQDELVPNDEHRTIRDLVRGYLGPNQESTEFANNLYLAKTQGYVELSLDGAAAQPEIGAMHVAPGEVSDAELIQARLTRDFTSEDDRAVAAALFAAKLERLGLGTMRVLRHPHPARPWRFMVEPFAQKPGLGADLTLLHNLLDGGLHGRQIVAGDNGIYRTSLQLLIERWAAQHRVEFAAPPVILGDEAGFSVDYADARGELIKRIDTPDRPPENYLNEFLVIWKIARKAGILPPAA